MGRAPTIVVVVDADEDVGQRADVVLGRRVMGLSRRVARRLGLQGRITIDSRNAPPSTRVALGATIAVHGDVVAGTTPPVTVLAITDAFVYVDKPAGVHTHRLRPDEAPTLADAVAARFPECANAGADPREGGAVHRLDHETTGVVAFARSRAAWEAGRAALTAGAALKHYIAVCEGPLQWPPPSRRFCALVREPLPELPAGVPEPASAEALCVRAPLSARGRVEVREAGVHATTIVWPLAHRAPERVVVALRLATGRRHQARVHLAWTGWPILGDAQYGSQTAESGPLALHAYALELDKEVALPGEPRVVSPLPEAFARMLDEPGLKEWPP